MSKKWTVVSILSRFSTEGIGLIQSLLIVKLLTVESYGLLNIVMGLGASLGVYQNLGISSGSTREIAAAENKKEASKIFLASLTVRYMISLPLAIGLMIFAQRIALSMNNSQEIIFPLQLFAVTMIIQSLQSTLSSIVQGFKKFNFLFTFQIVRAVLSIGIFIPLIMSYGFVGYFYALVIFNIVVTIIPLIYCAKLIGTDFTIPTFEEYKRILKSVFKIGMYVYVMKIIDTQWYRLQPFLLGFVTTDYKIGLFSFALLIASKLGAVSDAITDVTLPSMTTVYERSKEEFKKTFLKGSTFANILLTLAVVILILFKAEIFWLIDLIFSPLKKEPLSVKYSPAFVYVDILAIGFWAYSQLNLIRSAFSVPAKKLRGSFFAYILLFVLTYIFYYTINGSDPIRNLSIAMALASFASYIFLLLYSSRESKFWMITLDDIVYIVLSALVVIAFYMGVSNILLIIIYCLFTFWIYKTSEKNY